MTAAREHTEPAVPPHPALIPRRRLALYVCVIVLLGAGLRFYHITEMEPRIWDEGVYLLEGRYLSSFCSAVWNSAQTFLEEKLTHQDLWKKELQIEQIRERTCGLPPKYGRILHNTFIAAGNLLAGPKPYMGNLVSAILGTLTIFWVFMLGRRMFNERVGLCAALIFSVMGYHIHYSRSGLAEAGSLFFLVPAFYYYYKSRCSYPVLSCRDLVLCGLFLGVGFTVHNRCMMLAGLICLLDLVFLWRDSSLTRQSKTIRIALFLTCFLLPSCIWEGFYHVVLLVFKRLQIVMTTPTYLEQVLYGFWHSLLWGYISENFRLAGFLVFPYLYLYMNGIVASLLLLAGLYAAVRRRSLADQILGVWFLVPLVLYSLTNAGLTRFFSLILAPAAVLSSAALFSVSGRNGVSHRRSRKGNLVRAVALLLLILSGCYCAWTRILPPGSGYARSMDFLLKAGDPRIVATGVPLCQVYMGVDKVTKPPESMQELERLYKDGFRYYVIDYTRIIYTYYQMDRVRVLDHVASGLEPVFSVSNEFILEPQNAFEGNLYFWKTMATLRKGKQEQVDRIRIYDLKEYFEASVQGSSP